MALPLRLTQAWQSQDMMLVESWVLKRVLVEVAVQGGSE